MPGGSAAVLASKFRGLNRFAPPYLLDPAQSPDCADCAAYNGKSGLLGPRAGRKFLSHYANKVRGVIPVNLNWTKFFLVAQGDGSITPVSSPAPSPPVVGLCSSAEYMNRNPSTGPTGPLGSRIYFSLTWNCGVQSSPASGKSLGLIRTETGLGVGWSGFTSLGLSYDDGSGTRITCSPNGDLIEGYLRGGYTNPSPVSFSYFINTAGGVPSTSAIFTYMATDDGVLYSTSSIGPPGTALHKGNSSAVDVGTGAIGNPIYIF